MAQYQKLLYESLEIKRLKGLAESFTKVSSNITKYAFNEKKYLKYVNYLGGKKTKEREKIFKGIQRALFIA